MCKQTKRGGKAAHPRDVVRQPVVAALRRSAQHIQAAQVRVPLLLVLRFRSPLVLTPLAPSAPVATDQVDQPCVRRAVAVVGGRGGSGVDRHVVKEARDLLAHVVVHRHTVFVLVTDDRPVLFGLHVERRHLAKRAADVL